MHAHPIVIELYVLEDVLLGLVPRPIAPLFHQFPFQRLEERGRVLTLDAPISGDVIPLSEVNDQTFATGLLGQGVAIRPTGTRVIAPADAKVEAIFPTGHAVALNTVDGLDVLIHVGLDTVQLEGKHFTVHAQVGDIVHKGDVLIEFDREAIAAEGYDVTVPILVCNSVEFSSIKGSVGVHVEEMDQLIVARER